jgi:hypothetical protein
MWTSKASVDLQFEENLAAAGHPLCRAALLRESIPSNSQDGTFPPKPSLVGFPHTSWLPACSRCVPKHVPIEQSLFTMFATMFVSVEIRETVPKHVWACYFLFLHPIYNKQAHKSQASSN